MPLDVPNKIKIKNFLKTNLETLKGPNLEEFIERYRVQEADMVHMMLLDFGMTEQFVSVPHPTKPKIHYVVTVEMAEKILFLEESESIL